MKPEDNIVPFKKEPASPFKRYENGLYVPKDHNPNHPIIYQHEFNVEQHGHYIASIIAGKPGEYLFNEVRASIDVWSTGDTLIFSNGLFGENIMKGSIFIPTTPFPGLALKLFMEPWAVDDEEEFVSEEIEATYPGGEGAVFFEVLTMELPCEALQLVKHWDYFEDSRLDALDRFLALFQHPCGKAGLKEFQEHWEILGLKLGRKHPHQNFLKSLDTCLDLIETWHWEEVRRSSTKPR